jgi:hypothetical protein
MAKHGEAKCQHDCDHKDDTEVAYAILLLLAKTLATNLSAIWSIFG